MGSTKVMAAAREKTPESWYEATAQRRAYPRLTGAHRSDVAVIGGGLTGLSAALALAERGFGVVLLEARRVGWGASGRNGGQLLTGFNKGLQDLTRAVGADDARRLWRFAEDAKALVHDTIARHRISCDVRPGHLTAAVRPGHLPALQDWADELAALGYDRAQILSDAEVQEHVACPLYAGGLYDAGSSHLHPLRYVIGLAEAAARSGVRIFEESPVTTITQGGGIAVSTPAGSIAADHLVIAGNAYLQPIAPWLGPVHAAIMPVTTFVVATEPLGDDLAQTLIPADCAVADTRLILNYYRRTADHRLLWGGGASYSTVHAPWVEAGLRRTMRRHFPALAAAGIAYRWAGNVAITRSRLPQLARPAPNVYLAHGFSGHGLALTGIAGRTMAEAVAGTAERFDVFARLPHRRFIGGRAFRTPLLALAMMWQRLRDLL